MRPNAGKPKDTLAIIRYNGAGRAFKFYCDGASMPFSPIPEILDELKAGKPIVLVDDEDRENEGDIVYAAETVTPEAMNFMVKQARGVVCLALTAERCDKLHLRPLLLRTNPTKDKCRGFASSQAELRHSILGFAL